MAQHDYVVENQSGASFRADLNNALAAAASLNSGAAAPSTTYAYMLWADTTTGLLKIRNAANTGWVTLGSLSAANLGLASLAGATFTGPVTLPSGSAVAGYLPLASAGCRNLLINANPIINQRGYVSGTTTTAANQFTLDRWFVVTSGQSLSWTDSSGIRTVTAPSGGVAQVIEGAGIAGTGTHVLNWTGTATATVNGTAVSKGVSFTLTGGANAVVKFASGTFALPQLEPGSTATGFEERLPGPELALCQRYHETFSSTSWLQFVKPASAYSRIVVPWRVAKRATPTVSIVDFSNNAGKYSTWSASDTRTDSRTPIGVVGTTDLFILTTNNTDSDVGCGVGAITASAELTS
jgi:hypothetical protein